MTSPEQEHCLPVSPNDHFSFHCTHCAECCKHVHDSVAISSLDVFRLTKYLRDHGVGGDSTDDVLCRFASPLLITEAGYFAYFLNTVGEDEHCIFLNGNRCSIQDAKPNACRMYPLQAAPDKDGSFQIVLCTEKQHHFKGNSLKVKNWFNRNMPADVREFYRFELGTAPTIQRLLLAIPESRKSHALLLFHQYLYSDFDLDKPFMNQFRVNTCKLIRALEGLK